MSGKRRKYSKEFKGEAINLAEELGVVKATEEFDIHPDNSSCGVVRQIEYYSAGIASLLVCKGFWRLFSCRIMVVILDRQQLGQPTLSKRG